MYTKPDDKDKNMRLVKFENESIQVLQDFVSTKESLKAVIVLVKCIHLLRM